MCIIRSNILTDGTEKAVYFSYPWTRGLIISFNGFSKDGLEAFSKGRPTNLITLDGQDLYAILSQDMSFVDVLKKKIRWAAETGEIAKSVFELLN